MEIAPVPGIRAVTLVEVRRAEEAPPAFAIDPSVRTEDDTYSGSGQSADGALEEGNSKQKQPDASGPEPAAERPSPGHRIDFFA